MITMGEYLGALRKSLDEDGEEIERILSEAVDGLVLSGKAYINDKGKVRLKDAELKTPSQQFAEAMQAQSEWLANRLSGSEQKDEPAKRFDAGKSRVDLIPPEFIEALGRHYGVGALKYAERNWEKGMSWSRCYGSAMRHMLAFWGGEEIDAETGTPHVIAAAWNMAALHYYALHQLGIDDRVKIHTTPT